MLKKKIKKIKKIKVSKYNVKALQNKSIISLGLVYQKFYKFTRGQKKYFNSTLINKKYFNLALKNKKELKKNKEKKKINIKNIKMLSTKFIYINIKKDPIFRLSLLEKFLTLFLRKGKKNIAFLFLVNILKMIKFNFYLIPSISFLSLLSQYKPSFYIGGFTKGKKKVSVPIGLYRDTQYIFSILYFFKILSLYSKEKNLLARMEKEFFLLLKMPKQAKLTNFLNEHYLKVFDTIKNVNYKW